MWDSALGGLMGDSVVRAEREVWGRLRRGDEGALAELFHQHSDAVYNFAFRRTGSWSVAEDVVQATFTVLWRRAAQGRIDDELTLDTALPLLLGIARFECANATRSARRLVALKERIHQVDGNATVPDHSAQAAATVDSERAMRELREILGSIPARQREVVELVVWSGCTMAEAAQTLGVPEGTVKSRLARARKKLAGLIDFDTKEALS